MRVKCEKCGFKNSCNKYYDTVCYKCGFLISKIEEMPIILNNIEKKKSLILILKDKIRNRIFKND